MQACLIFLHRKIENVELFSKSGFNCIPLLFIFKAYESYLVIGLRVTNRGNVITFRYFYFREEMWELKIISLLLCLN